MLTILHIKLTISKIPPCQTPIHLNYPFLYTALVIACQLVYPHHSHFLTFNNTFIIHFTHKHCM